jgi:hypothetical protein
MPPTDRARKDLALGRGTGTVRHNILQTLIVSAHEEDHDEEEFREGVPSRQSPTCEVIIELCASLPKQLESKSLYFTISCIPAPPDPERRDSSTYVSPLTLPPPSASHGIYLDLSGYRIRVHHEGYDACPRSCNEKEAFYWISGHIHFDPDAPPPPGPLAVSPCRIWWDTGEKPEDLNRDCTQEIRALASAYRQLLLASLVEDSAEWDWFPPLDAILSMSAEDLVAMKIRADAQLQDPQPLRGR